jgi:hypothetical protein
MDELAKLGNKEMRWSSCFESAVQESMRLSTNVESCDDIGNGCFWVKQHDAASASTVNTETKIIHLGQLYTIPTCDCGFWTSTFMPCLCIVRGLKVSPRGSLSDAFDVNMCIRSTVLSYTLCGRKPCAKWNELTMRNRNLMKVIVLIRFMIRSNVSVDCLQNRFTYLNWCTIVDFLSCSCKKQQWRRNRCVCAASWQIFW